jgi:hypothetical protein
MKEQKRARVRQMQMQAELNHQHQIIQQGQKRLTQAKKLIWQKNQEVEHLHEEIQRLQEAALEISPGRKLQTQREEEARLFLEQQREQQQREEDAIHQAFEKQIDRASSHYPVILGADSDPGSVGETPSTEPYWFADMQQSYVEVGV